MSKCYLLFAEGLEECEGLITLDILRRAGLETYTVSVEDAHTVVGAHGVPVTCDRTLPELLAKMSFSSSMVGPHDDDVLSILRIRARVVNRHILPGRHAR